VHQREGDYREALRAYQAVLKCNPECPAAIRVGIGICLSRLDCADNVCVCVCVCVWWVDCMGCLGNPRMSCPFMVC
jgi:hypothetical protein